MSLTFDQSHRLQEHLNFCNHSDIKRQEVSQTFLMVDYVRMMTVEKSCKVCMGDVDRLSICSFSKKKKKKKGSLESYDKILEFWDRESQDKQFICLHRELSNLPMDHV